MLQNNSETLGNEHGGKVSYPKECEHIAMKLFKRREVVL